MDGGKVAIVAAIITAVAAIIAAIITIAPQFFKHSQNTEAVPTNGVDETANMNLPSDPDITRLLRLKTRDGKENLLQALYGFPFDYNSPFHTEILKNILSQINIGQRQYGVYLDIDRLTLVYGKAPLVCRNLSDLEQILQNQLEIYRGARQLIIRLFGLHADATYENDPLLRQIVTDYESKIRTPFRTKGIRLNLKTNKIESTELTFRSVAEVIGFIGNCLESRIALRIKPGPSDYDVSHIDRAFFPTGGFNIL